MEILFNQLDKIDELLEQISVMTFNQATVLIQPNTDEEEKMNLLETMVNYKEEIINELEKVEGQFNNEYSKKREQICSNKDVIVKFKERVQKILDKKQSIQEMEENNVRTLCERNSVKLEPVKISKNPNDAVAAYKKQQTKC